MRRFDDGFLQDSSTTDSAGTPPPANAAQGTGERPAVLHLNARK